MIMIDRSHVSHWIAGACLLWPRFALAAGLQPTEPEIRRRLKEVLARPEFSQHEKTLSEMLAEQLARLFAWLGALRNANPILFWLLLVGCLLLLLLLGIHIGWSIRRMLAGGTSLQEAAVAQEKRRRQSLAYWEEAQRRAAERDFTEAIRFLFLSLVYAYDENGRVGFQNAYTNREYLSLFADRPEVRSELAVFVDTLDDHWYGQRPTDEARYQECLALYQSLK
ncbi:MAG TPA: DUF4129 domain-containing protein [Gemmataceae bacterium]|nr:DUF4129 domain-containing protein [Gemmataceae bacterium]